jgi:cytochrome c553
VSAVLVLIVLAPLAPSAASTDLRSQAAAVTPNPEHGEILYRKHCAACHRLHAWGDGPREIPALAGQRQLYLIEQLALFAGGERVGSDMHGPAMPEILKRPDIDRPQAISDLAAYLARAPRNPEPEQGEGRGLSAGTHTYALACSACHGVDGAGSDGGPVAAIGGQHYSYLLARLRGFAAGGRGHPRLAVGLTAAEQGAVADYTSRLTALSSVGSR